MDLKIDYFIFISKSKILKDILTTQAFLLMT